MPSLYTPHLTSDATLILLEGEEFHHLSHVKRIAVGHRVKLNNGQGLIAEAIVKTIDKRKAELSISQIYSFPPIEQAYAIAFTLLKNKHDELIVEKCTELGVTALFPLETEHSVKSASANTLSRYEKIALAAIKQCDNPWLPNVMPVRKLERAIAGIIDYGFTPVLCSELRPDIGIASLDKQCKPCFIIGPEGGFSEQEFALFESLGIASISIGKLITRAETAAIAVAAQFLTLQ